MGGLILDAALSGIFESAIFAWYLSIQATEHRVEMRLLAFVIVAGHLLMPHALSRLGLPTHISLHMKPSTTKHRASIMTSGLTTELLIFARQSVFARLWLIHVAPGKNFLF